MSEYMNIYKYILALDMVITLSLVFYFQVLIDLILISYFSQLILSTILSFYWSLEFPQKVNLSIFSSTPVVGFIPALFTLILFVPFIIGYNIDLVYNALGIGCFFVAIVLFYRYKTYYVAHSLGVYSKLYT